MNIVTFNEYENDKLEFFNKHYRDFTCDTIGNSAEYYTKTYMFNDGAVWYEVSRMVEVEEIVNVHKCDVKVRIDMLQTEYWSNDKSESKFYYEPWDVMYNTNKEARLCN